MRKVIMKEDVMLTGVRNSRGEEKMIDYYFEVRGKDRMYAFTRKYTSGTYDLCKSGIRVNVLATKRSRDKSIMSLVSYLKITLRYFSEYYGLPQAA